MQLRYRYSRLMCAVLVAAVGAGLASAQHAGDVWVGRTTQGRVAISPQGFLPELSYHGLSPVGGVLNGWSDANPGFDHLTTGDPNDDVFPFQSGAAIWLEVITIDAALRIIDGGFNVLDEPGEDTLLGGAGLHVHNTWHINSDDPAFDPNQCVWHTTVLLRDDGGTGYDDSAPLTFSFANVPVRPATEPADGDFDESGAAGATDLPAVFECLSGPGTRPQPDDPAITTCEVLCLNAFDSDNDLDIDLCDVEVFQQLFSGD